MDKNDQLFADTFENAGVGIALVDISGIPYRSNKAFCNILGYTSAELGKMSFDQFTHPEDVRKDLDLFEQLLNGTIEKYAMEKRYITKNKAVIWVILNVSLVKDDQNTYAIAIVQDITDRKKAKLHLEHSNRQLEQFAYLSSHDLQQPLSNIQGFLELFIDSYSDKVDDEGKEFLALINKSTHQLKSKLNAILDYSRIGRNPEIKNCDLGKIIHEEWEKLKELWEQKHATIKVDPIDFAFVDEGEFRTLVHHLLKNSLIFSSPNRVPAIKIVVNRSPESLHIKFQDNGMGIAEHYYERVFQIFQQLNEKSTYDGLGIGLAYSKKIVEHLGGKIWIDSVLDKYCNVNFTIPYKR